MKNILIVRDLFIDDKATLGVCFIFDEGKQIFKSETLERAYLDNKKSISCIPAGNYEVALEYSPRFNKQLWEIKGVPGRSECKFHAANYWDQLNGCIALGRSRKKINSDDVLDITNSRNTMADFHAALEDQEQVILTIININEL
ncbi:hypothetical protein Phi39:1_gp30 [Cellulophaga phage phi39:1]|uniref:hypothetical protein n=1 Tax=Cellulophaga phage phi39:1 TaxID=1327993 RepID=UPI000351D7B9|nr:hypothetical protein Phi39:1_gp30 [Cellulophaga phage phi39:1]AGO49145.1 hypothetical protein Phi39:1_gp30 [Cellulophaga phage phi39:1]